MNQSDPDIWYEDSEPEDDATKELYDARAKFIHRVFKQDQEGQQMLDDMVNATIRSAVVHPGDSQFAAGIREGRASIVRMLLDQIDYAEKL